MQDMNSVNLIGRCATEPELKTGAYSKLDFSMVFNTSKKNGEKYEDEGNFINLTLWGKTADNMSRFLHKGQQIAISGHLHVDTWEKDGKKNSALKLVADSIQLIGSSKKSDAPSNDADDIPEDLF